VYEPIIPAINSIVRMVPGWCSYAADASVHGSSEGGREESRMVMTMKTSVFLK
jgi:hypothetical protein